MGPMAEFVAGERKMCKGRGRWYGVVVFGGLIDGTSQPASRRLHSDEAQVKLSAKVRHLEAASDAVQKRGGGES